MSGETERISILESAAEAVFVSFVGDVVELRVLFRSEVWSEDSGHSSFRICDLLTAKSLGDSSNQSNS